jgi:hypothetical protein
LTPHAPFRYYPRRSEIRVAAIVSVETVREAFSLQNNAGLDSGGSWVMFAVFVESLPSVPLLVEGGVFLALAVAWKFARRGEESES